jgi:hypothetical protein
MEARAGTSDRERTQIDRRQPMPADQVTQGNIPLGLMQKPLLSRFSRMPHDGASKMKYKKINIWISFSTAEVIKLGTQPPPPATPQNLTHSRANTDLHNSHNTQHTRVKQNELFFMLKDTQSSY